MTDKGLLGNQLLGDGLLGQEFDTVTSFEFSPTEGTTGNNTVTVSAEKTQFQFSPLQSTDTASATSTSDVDDRPQFNFTTILPIRRSIRLLTFDLDKVGVWDSGDIRWDASTSSTTNFIVEVSKDQRKWTEISSSGDDITLFSQGDIVLGEDLFVRLVLESENDTDTPTVNNFKVDVDPR